MALKKKQLVAEGKLDKHGRPHFFMFIFNYPVDWYLQILAKCKLTLSPVWLLQVGLGSYGAEKEAAGG